MLVLINQDYDDKPPICHYKNVSMCPVKYYIAVIETSAVCETFFL